MSEVIHSTLDPERNIFTALENNFFDKNIIEICVNKQIDNYTDWQFLYLTASYLYKYSPNGSNDKLIINRVELAFDRGLIYNRFPQIYLEAAKIIANLYFKYSSYKKAGNYLLLIRDLDKDESSDWINLYFAKSLIHTDFNALVLNPSYLFSLLKLESKTKLSEQEIAVVRLFVNFIPDKIDPKYLCNRNIIDNLLIQIQNAILPFEEYFSDDFNQLLSFFSLSFDESDNNTDQNSSKFPAMLKLGYLRVMAINDVFREKIINLESINQEQQKEIEYLKNENVNIQNYIQTQISEIRHLALEENDCSNIFPKTRILVLGATSLDVNVMQGLAKKAGLEKECLNFHLDYNDNKRFDIDNLKYNSPYSGILIGPIAHKVIGLGDYNSAIDKITQEEGYPPAVVMLTKSGTLKITKQSFNDALKKLLTIIESNIV